ncbi:hypothetical protein Q9233_015113 [Columba guinea]|nr:hypothetical protein Q9233_015113 [Columba guinea]
MASAGPEEGEVTARDEQALRKLVVRLQNVQERKRLETLVQTLSDLLELAARQSDVIAFLLLEEEVDVFSLVFNAMHTFPKNEDIQRHGCKALHKLFEKVPEEQLTEFVESKDHMIILKVFKEFPAKEEVILPALYSLHSLAGPSSNVEVLMSGNVRCYNVIVEMMQSFPNSETVQEVSCCLLHKLTVGKFPKLIYCEYFLFQAETIFLNRDLEERKEEEEEEKLCWLEACYRALELHQKNTDVLEAACWALKNLFLYQRNLHEKIGDGNNQSVLIS